MTQTQTNDDSRATNSVVTRLKEINRQQTFESCSKSDVSVSAQKQHPRMNESDTSGPFLSGSAGSWFCRVMVLPGQSLQVTVEQHEQLESDGGEEGDTREQTDGDAPVF